MKRVFLSTFFRAVLDLVFQNVYFFMGLFYAYLAFKETQKNMLAMNLIMGGVMFFVWIADQIKVAKNDLRKDLTAEIQSRVEGETQRIKHDLIQEIRRVDQQQ